MAKRKPAGELAGDVAEGTFTEIDPAFTESDGKVETQSGEVIIFAPLGDENGYAPMGVTARLDGKQKKTLRRLLNGLNARDVRLNNGTHVKDHAHVVQYLLEQVAANA